MTGSYFVQEEFYRDGIYIPPVVKYKIDIHIRMLNKVREELKAPIIVSKKSGYRPVLYELAKGRSGKSEHTFRGKGAVDLTCREDKLQELFELLQESDYTRVCLYPEQKFIHCDMKPVTKKQVFFCLGNGWERVS